MMSAALDEAAKSMYDGKVPAMWLGKSYPSLKPLAAYIANLKERIAFL
jgi:dynein heavy chain